MDSLTGLLQFGFRDSLVQDAEKHLRAEKYLNETWQQIQKDFRLSALPYEGGIMPNDLEELMSQVLQNLPAQEAISARANLLYRIDLPPKIAQNLASNDHLAMAIIMRAFQKVWLRQQLS